MNSRVLIGSALAVAFLAVGLLAGSVIGSGLAFAQTPPPNATAPSSPGSAQAAITQQQAEQAALAANPGATVDHTHLFQYNGTSAYDVDFSNGGGAIVDATTGKVIQSEAAGTDYHGGRGGFGQDQAALAAKATVTKDQAEKAALAASPGATVDHSRLGQDQSGTIFWDVDFSNGGGAVVNATTGAIIKTEAAGTDHGGPHGPPATKP